MHFSKTLANNIRAAATGSAQTTGCSNCRFTSFGEDTFATSSCAQPAGWGLYGRPLQRPVKTCSDFIEVLAELLASYDPLYSLFGDHPDGRVDFGFDLVTSLYALAVQVECIEHTGKLPPQPPPTGEWIDDIGIFGFPPIPYFDRDDTLAAVMLLWQWALAHHKASPPFLTGGRPPAPAQSAAVAHAIHTMPSVHSGASHSSSAMLPDTPAPPPARSISRPANWTKGKCPVELPCGNSATIYGVAVDDVTDNQKTVLKLMIARFEAFARGKVAREGLRGSDFERNGIDYVNGVLRNIRRLPTWREIIHMPKKGHAEGYYIIA